jgi:hypothetical protein
MQDDRAMRLWWHRAGDGGCVADRLARAPAVASLVAIAAVAVLAAWHVWLNYSLWAWSDPLNWLRFARNLRTEFSTSMFPVGYPLFLRVALDVLGPYLVFFANFPLILISAFLGARIVGAAVSERTGGSGALPAQAFAFACLAACDPEMVVLQTNPYRDPLSYVYLFGSIVLLWGYLAGRPHRIWRLACSGLLFGAAYSVREPSLLMAGPMGLCVLIYWRGDRDIPLLKGGLAFALAAIVGASPLIAQSFACHGGLLPPQISTGDFQTSSGINIGDMALFRRNAGVMVATIGNVLAWLSVPFILGTCYAVADRSRPMLAIVLPGCAMYSLIYLFYNTFWHRYYYVVVLMAAMIASYGIYRLAADAGRFLERRLGERRAAAFAAPAAGVALAALGIAYAAFQFVPRGPRPATFRLAQAREFASTMSRHVPAGGRPVIICRRNLCELIECFGGVESYDTPFFANVEPGDRLRALKTHIDGLIASGRQVYFIDFHRKETDARDSGPVSQLFDLTFVSNIPLGHCVPAGWGISSGALFAVSQPTNTHAGTVAARPLPYGGWLEVRAGLLWGAGNSRSNAVLRIGDAVVTDRLPDGLSVFPIRANEAGGELAVALDSDRPFASALSLRVRAYSDVLCYDFNYFAAPFAGIIRGDGLIHPDPRPFHPGPRYRLYPAVTNSAFASLVAPAPPVGMLRVMEVSLRSVNVCALPDDQVVLLADGHEVGGVRVGRAGESAETEVALDASVGERFTLELRRQHGVRGRPAPMRRGDDPDALFIERVRFAYLDAASSSAVFAAGSVGDTLMMRGGFWRLETPANGMPGFWTTGRARLCLQTAEPQRDGTVVLVANTALRPPAAGPANLSVLVNGHSVPLNAVTADAATQVRTFEGVVPQAWLCATNDVEIVCNPWRPGDYGSGDTRTLGVVVHSLEIR